MGRRERHQTEVRRAGALPVVLLGVGWLFALLSLPSVVGIQILEIGPDWLEIALLCGVLVPAVAAGLLGMVMSLR